MILRRAVMVVALVMLWPYAAGAALQASETTWDGSTPPPDTDCPTDRAPEASAVTVIISFAIEAVMPAPKSPDSPIV